MHISYQNELLTPKIAEVIGSIYVMSSNPAYLQLQEITFDVKLYNDWCLHNKRPTEQ